MSEVTERGLFCVRRRYVKRIDNHKGDEMDREVVDIYKGRVHEKSNPTPT